MVPCNGGCRGLSVEFLPDESDDGGVEAESRDPGGDDVHEKGPRGALAGIPAN